MVGNGLQLLSLLPELAFVCQSLDTEFLACPDASSNCLTPSAAVPRKLFPVLRVDAYQDLFNFDGGGNRSARRKPPVHDPR
jgi:hypothetical protein